MATLLERLRNNSQAAASNAAAPAQASDQDLTAQTQRLLSAKSGKAVGSGSAPAASNIQEQIERQNQANQALDLAQKAQVGAEVMKANEQAQASAIKQQEIEQTAAAEAVDTDFLNQQEAVLNNYLQGQKQLNLQKDKAAMEQVGFGIRLNDSQYLANMEREAKRAQLTSDIRFREEMARTVFSDELSMFQDNLDFRAAMFADKQDFVEQMANMDLDYALQMAEQESRQASSAMMFEGISSGVSGGATAYSNYQQSQQAAQTAQAKKDYYTTGAGKEDTSFEATQARKK